LQSGNNPLQEAVPSGSLAIQTELDPLLTKADSLGGCVVSLENSLPEQSKSIKLKVNLFKEIIGVEKKQPVEPIKTHESLLLSINTSISLGVVLRAKGDEIELSLKIPVVLIPGKVGIARNLQGHWRLIGWGEIL
jgi:translation initiation factor 2 gamma subunit (eIF-2gamma)